MAATSDPKKACRNCGEVLTGPYCSRCGQKQTDLNLPIKRLLSEFLEDAFTFDSRFFRTFIPLAIKPGHLTIQFNEGKRIRYVTPFRLYLFISVIFFFLLAMTDATVVQVTPPTATEGQAGPDTSRQQIADSTVVDSTDVEEILAPRGDLSLFRRLKRNFLLKLNRLDLQALNATVVNRLPQLMFFMVPLFALFLKLLYIRTDPLYIQHLVFALHYHSFMFLLMAVAIASYLLTEHRTGYIILLWLPVYLLLSLKRVYRQSIVWTLAKLVLLAAAYVAVLLVSLLVVIIMTVLLQPMS